MMFFTWQQMQSMLDNFYNLLPFPCAVGGGAIRDALLNNNINDIDAFVWHVTEKELKQRLSDISLGYQPVEIKSVKGSTVHLISQIFKISVKPENKCSLYYDRFYNNMTIGLLKNVDVDFDFFKDFIKLAPPHLSRIAYYDGEIKVDEDFILDCFYRIITAQRSIKPGADENTVKMISKLHKKYPEFKLNLAPELLELKDRISEAQS